MTSASQNKLFHRIAGLDLTPGNKSAGFNLVVNTATLAYLRGKPVAPHIVERLQSAIRERILNAKLLPKKYINQCHIWFVDDTLCPRCFVTEPSFGGSLGASPNELAWLTRPDVLEWIGETMDYTPHNVDLPAHALALLVMVETWAEFVRAMQYEMSSEAPDEAPALTVS